MSFLGYQRQQQEWWTGGGSAEDPSASFRSSPPLARDLLTPFGSLRPACPDIRAYRKAFLFPNTHCALRPRTRPPPPHSRLTHQMSASAVAANGFECCTLTASAPRVTDTCGVSVRPRFGAVGRTRSETRTSAMAKVFFAFRLRLLARLSSPLFTHCVRNLG
jgi:hypothetical protein